MTNHAPADLASLSQNMLKTLKNISAEARRVEDDSLGHYNALKWIQQLADNAIALANRPKSLPSYADLVRAYEYLMEAYEETGESYYDLLTATRDLLWPELATVTDDGEEKPRAAD
jgi:hypothetical protein